MGEKRSLVLADVAAEVDNLRSALASSPCPEVARGKVRCFDRLRDSVLDPEMMCDECAAYHLLAHAHRRLEVAVREARRDEAAHDAVCPQSKGSKKTRRGK